MLRAIVPVLALALATGHATGPRAARGDDPAYAHANSRLARATPHYPRARLLVAEPINGEVGTVPFEAVQRIYFLSRPTSQRTVIGFYRRKLGAAWRPRGAACLVPRSRL